MSAELGQGCVSACLSVVALVAKHFDRGTEYVTLDDIAELPCVTLVVDVVGVVGWPAKFLVARIDQILASA